MEDTAFPGLSMLILNHEKDTLIFNPNLVGTQTDGMTFNPLQLNAYFTVVLPPLEKEKKYKVQFNIWDKKGEGTFYYELPFTVKENTLLDIVTNNIQYDNIYLWNKTLKQGVFEKTINPTHEYVLLFEGLNGLDVIDGKVYPALSLNLVDGNGNKIISNPNVLATFEKDGIEVAQFIGQQLPINLTFEKGQTFNPLRLSAELKDLKSEKRLVVNTLLEVN